MYRAENGPAWPKEPKLKGKVLRGKKAPESEPPDTDKDLFQPVSSTGMHEHVYAFDEDEDDEEKANDAERLSVPTEHRRPSKVDWAHWRDMPYDPDLYPESKDEEGLLRAKGGAGLPRLEHSEDVISSKPKSRERKVVTVDGAIIAPRVRTNGVEIRGNMEDGYQITAHGGGMKSTDLTASLHPSVWDDLEREEHIQHAREFLRAVNEVEEASAANSNIPVVPKGGKKKRSKRAAA